MGSRIKIILILLGALLSTNRMIGQSVTVDAKIDSLQILIGQQTKIILEVSTDADQHTIFPSYTDTLVRGVEIVDIAKPDTQYLDQNRRLLLKREYTITSFDSALYYIPPMKVLVDSVAYQSKALALKVYSVPVPIDPEHPDHFFGPKSVMQVPFMWEDWCGVIISVVLLVPLVLLLIYLLMRIFDNKPIIHKIKLTPQLPPHQLAMQEMERIKKEKVWQKGLQKEYYTELIDVLRLYIQRRFGFNALEMTSSEIINKLLEVQDRKAIDDLRELFHTADLVKFAKHNPMMNENDKNLLNAIDFINETKQINDANTNPQPTEVTVIEKRTLRSKIYIVSAILIFGAAAIYLLIYVCREVYNFFF